MAPLGDTNPSPTPTTVTLCPSTGITFLTPPPPDTPSPSYDTSSLADPATPPSVTVTLVLIALPTPVLHCSVVSDTHELISHPVTPTRPSGLAPVIQKLSPTTLIIVDLALPAFVPSTSSNAPSDPPSSPASSRTPPRLPTIAPSDDSCRLAPRTSALSYDTPMLMLPACPPAVNATRNVLNTPPGVLHITLLSDTHDVPSHDVCPTSTDPDAPYAPRPTPITTVSSPPGSIRFDRPTADTTPASADTIPVADPTALPDVNDTRLVRDTECDRKHTTADSDTHSVLAQEDCPARRLRLLTITPYID